MDTTALSQQQVEAIGIEWVKEATAGWISPDHPIIDTNRMRQRVNRQGSLGDLLVTDIRLMTAAVEIKTERRHTGNLFIETWSNLTHDEAHRRDGWIFTLQADVIAFVFLDQEVVYMMQFPNLKAWCINKGGMYKFPQRQAGMSAKGLQKNNTIGHCVPIYHLREQIRIIEYSRANEAWQYVPELSSVK